MNTQNEEAMKVIRAIQTRNQAARDAVRDRALTAEVHHFMGQIQIPIHKEGY